MSKYDSQTPLAHQSWLSHTQKQQDYRCQALRQCINCSHSFLSSRCVWHRMNQPHANVFPGVWLPNNRTHLTTCRQPGTHHSRAAATYTDDSERDRSPKAGTTSYETKTAVSHRLISLTGILANRRRTNCCWIFSHGQDVHNIMQSLWMLGIGSERPLWLRPQGHLAQ